MEPLALLARMTAGSMAGWVVVLGTLTALEFLFGRSRQDLGARMTGLAFWTLWIPVTATTVFVFHQIWRQLGITPLFTIDLSVMGMAALVLAPLLSAFIGDFFFYWCHRAEHKWLWRLHSVHHSVRDLSAVNSYHHVSEAAVQTLLISVPMSLLVRGHEGLAIMGLLLWLHPVFLHSPVRFGFGPLRAVLADNHFHRIHHSLEPAHFDRNFGAFTIFWDRLFGTAYMPRPDEWPDVGLADVPPPHSVCQWLMPWRRDEPARAPEVTAAEGVRALP